MTISGAKTAIGMPGITIVGMFVIGRLGSEEGTKILDCPTPRTTEEPRGFVGIVVYYRIFIAGFATIAHLSLCSSERAFGSNGLRSARPQWIG